MGNSVDNYLGECEGAPGDVARALRTMILGIAPELEESFKWGQPVYASNGPVCYFRAGKNHVTFGFWRGVALGKVNSKLESGGDRMAHLKLAAMEDLDKTEVEALLTAAIGLNAAKGDPTKEVRTG